MAEARTIARDFAEQRGADAAVTLLQGGDATRERLSEAAPQARYLHVATHGWFAPESIRSWLSRRPGREFVPEFQALAEEAKGTDGAARAWTWVFRLADQDPVLSRKALDVLAADNLGSPELDDFVRELRYASVTGRST